MQADWEGDSGKDLNHHQTLLYGSAGQQTEPGSAGRFFLRILLYASAVSAGQQGGFASRGGLATSW